MDNINQKLARSYQGQWWLMIRAGKSVNGQPVWVREEGPFMTRKIADRTCRNSRHAAMVHVPRESC